MKPKSFARQRPLVLLSLAYAMGIGCASLIHSSPWFLAAGGITLAMGASLLSTRGSRLRFVSLCLAFMFLGLLMGSLALNPALPEEGDYLVNARVKGEVALGDDSRQAKALLDQVVLVDSSGIESRVAGAYWTFYPEEGGNLPLDGQRLRFEGSLYHPSGRVNPYGFDFKDYLLQKGITAGISGAKNLAFIPSVLSEPASIWLRARQAISTRLDNALGKHSELAKALLLGVRDGLDEEMSRDFRIAGVAHVLAVSGLHVGFLVYGLKKLLAFLHLSPKASLLVFTAFLLAYCRLLDFTPSVARASILSVMLLGGKALRRRPDPLTSLAAAFLLILLIWPLDLFNLGFQLSFLAVLGIFTLGDKLNSLMEGWPGFRKLPALAQMAMKAYALTFSASALTLVPLANAFHQVSIAGLLINPFAVFLIGFLLGGFILVLLVSYVSLPLALLIAFPAGWLSSGYQAVIAYFAGLPWASVRIGALRLWWFFALAGLLFTFTRYSVLKPRLRRVLQACLALMMIAAILLPGNTNLRYIQFSTGFSDSAAILDRNHTLVIDTGEHAGDLLNLLLSEGRIIDQLVLTHLHADHAGGLQQILESGIPVREILIPHGAEEANLSDNSLLLLNAAREQGIPVRELGRGDQIKAGRAEGEVLWPYKEALYPGMDPNRGALVVYWNLEGTSLLAASDLHADYAPYVLKPAQVLKAAHHGSKDDNTPALLSMVKPELALITAPEFRQERYQKARDALTGLGTAVLVTGETGAITLTFGSGELLAETFLKGED